MKNIKNIVSKFVHLQGIYKIILFGSRVNLPTKEDSDIDLCFVVEDEENIDKILEVSSNIILQTGLIIHPVIYTIDEFNEKVQISVYKESLIRNGKLLFLNKRLKPKRKTK